MDFLGSSQRPGVQSHVEDLTVKLNVYDVVMATPEDTSNTSNNSLLKNINNFTYAVGFGGVFHGGIVGPHPIPSLISVMNPVWFKISMLMQSRRLTMQSGALASAQMGPEFMLFHPPR
jgi:hypothetical protein